ncbi:MAG: response regulator [Fibrobacterales bacterium]
MKINLLGRLLIVDDEQEICEMLSRNFKLLGHAVETANNGVEALRLMNEKQFDVVISDIIMPEMNGVALLKEIRNKYPMLRVIMMSGYVTLDNALECMKNQAETFIFKPLNDLEELENAVNTAMQSLFTWNTKFLELRGLNPVKKG